MNSVSWPVEETKKVHLEKVNLFVYAEGLRNVVDTAASRYHGKKGGSLALFCTWKLCLFWNFLLRCPLCPGSLFRWLRSSILFQTTFFSLPAPSSQASGPVCPKQSFLSSSCLSQASVPFCPISSNSPFLSDLGALFGSRQSFPRAPTISLFLGPFLEALSLPPPPVIYDALWPRCTRWRAEPSSAAPWGSVCR